MSYILDALKKAERERGVARLPVLTTASDLRGVRGNRPTVIAGGLLLCAAAAVLIILYVRNTMVRPPESPTAAADQDRLVRGPGAEQKGQTPTAKKPSAPPATFDSERSHDLVAPDQSGRRPAPVSTSQSRPDAAVSSKDAMAQNPPSGARGVRPSGREETDSRQGTPEPAVTVAPVREPAAQAGQNASGTTTRETVPTPGDIQAKPAPLQEAMAKMTLNILVYEESEAARRVVINGKKYAKGDYVDGHYLIEDITLEGVLLSYDGVRAVLRAHP